MFPFFLCFTEDCYVPNSILINSYNIFASLFSFFVRVCVFSTIDIHYCVLCTCSVPVVDDLCILLLPDDA